MITTEHYRWNRLTEKEPRLIAIDRDQRQEPMMLTKPFWTSRTLWVNVLTAAVALGSGHLGFEVPAHVAVPLVAIANVILRFLTTQPVSF